MTGAPDPVYVAARRTLLDVLEALGPQRQAVTLVGAQAIYRYTSEDTSLAVAPYTADADLALDPDLLLDEPLLEQALTSAGFVRSDDSSKIGTWIGPGGVPVDLMVPEARAGGGRRSARIPPHAEGTARRARGLEASLVDRERWTVTALDPTDSRSLEVFVAGPGPLLVAKLLKIADRADSLTRLENKDALDVLRLLQAVSLDTLAVSLRGLRAHELSRGVTREAIRQLRVLFGAAESPGAQMAVAATRGLHDPEEIASSCAALAGDLLAALEEG
jgi:hypothetical protein